MSDNEELNFVGLDDEDNSHDEHQVNSDDEELFAASLKNKKHSQVAKKALSLKKRKATSIPPLLAKKGLGRFSDDELGERQQAEDIDEEEDELIKEKVPKRGGSDVEMMADQVAVVEEDNNGGDSSSSGAMFKSDGNDDGNDSINTPQSAKYTQDEEFTDPDDPVTVTKTHLHIDKVIMDEELERKIKYRRQEEEEDSKVSVIELKSFAEAPDEESEERTLLAKYRANLKDLEAKKNEESPPEGENEDEEFDADLICKTLKNKGKDQSVKKEMQREMVELNKSQVKEPDFIYDGENTLIKIGTQRY